MRRRAIYWASLACLGLALHQPGSAQAASSNADPQPAGFLCMVREGGPSTAARTALIAPARDAASLTSDGYRPVPCRDAFGSPAEQAAWREQVCLAAALQPDGFKAQLEALYGRHPATLCAMAEDAFGPWGRAEPRK